MKYLQTLDLILDDDMTGNLNLTFDAETAFYIMREIIYDEWGDYGLQWHAGSWREKYSMKVATIITRFGFCFTFNIIEPEEILYLDK